MSNGCFGGCCGGLCRRVRGAFRSIRARLLRRNLRHVHGERQGGTLNSPGCPDDGQPSSIQPVRYEQFFPGELTAATSVQENKRTIQLNGKYRSVGQPPSGSRQEDPSERTSLSQPPSGSSQQDSSCLESIVSSTEKTPLRGNIVRSSSQSSPPSVSGHQDSSLSMEYYKATIMLTQEAAAQMKKTSTFDPKTRALLIKAYECYKKAQSVNKSNRESASSRESATSRKPASSRESATSREPASSSRNPTQENVRDTLVSRSSGVFEDSFIFSYDEQLSSRSYTMVRRRYQASPMDRSLMRLIELRSQENLWTLIHICRRCPYVFKHLPYSLFIKGIHPSIVKKQHLEETSRKNKSYTPSPLSYDHPEALS